MARHGDERASSPGDRRGERRVRRGGSACLVLVPLAIAWLAAGCGLARTGTGPEPGATTGPTGGQGAGADGGSGQGGGEKAGQGGQTGDCLVPNDCPGVDGPCRSRTCIANLCGFDDATAGTACNDNGGNECDGEGVCLRGLGTPCALGDECVSGNCVDTVCCASASCGDDACTVCNAVGAEGVCHAAAEGTACDDGLYCNGDDRCDGAGACEDHAGDPCGLSSVAACSGTCNEAAGDCSASKPDGSSCDDGAYCNGTETCWGGYCYSSGDPCVGYGGCLTSCWQACDEDAHDCSAQAQTGTTCNNGYPSSMCDDYCNDMGSCVH